MKKKFDFKKLACPGPVIQTSKVLKEGGISSLEIVVDNLAAKENIVRFLKKNECEINEVMSDGEIYTIIASVSNKIKRSTNLVEEEKNYNNSGKTFIIKSNTIGSGDGLLGLKLMNAFLFTISEYEVAPKALFFMNSGVKLCVENSDALDVLKKISNRGAEITACGTCLDFYGITEKLAVGEIGNLYNLVEIFNGDSSVISM